MVNIPLFTWFYTSQVVQDFFHQQYFMFHNGPFKIPWSSIVISARRSWMAADPTKDSPIWEGHFFRPFSKVTFLAPSLRSLGRTWFILCIKHFVWWKKENFLIFPAVVSPPKKNARAVEKKSDPSSQWLTSCGSESSFRKANFGGSLQFRDKKDIPVFESSCDNVWKSTFLLGRPISRSENVSFGEGNGKHPQKSSAHGRRKSKKIASLQDTDG